MEDAQNRYAKKLLIITLAIVFLLTAVGLTINFSIRPGKATAFTDLKLPGETEVILRLAATATFDTAILFPRTEIYLYDSGGGLLDHAMYEGESSLGGGYFFATTPGEICFFFTNHTVIVNGEKAQRYDEKSLEVRVKGSRFAPSATGYSEEFGLYYALRNVGNKSKGSPYIYSIRFADDNGTYDVIIPYYLDGAFYDEGAGEFICVINSDFFGAENLDGWINYMRVYYDTAAGKFTLDERVYSLQNKELSTRQESGFVCMGMAKDGKLYQAYAYPDDPEQIHASGDMILSVYDLKSNELISNIMLKENYELGHYGGTLVGSSDLSGISMEGKLYVFCSTDQVYIITDEDNIEMREMPFSFENAASFRTTDKEFKAKGFVDTLIDVGKDGKIYVLLRTVDGKLQIYELLTGGKYEKIWEADCPKVKKDLYFVDFEVIRD